MRLTEFWRRMNASFGEGYAESFARDQVIAALGGRTIHEALAQGMEAKAVWRAVCATVDVPVPYR